MYRKGELVVYGGEGVCRVEDVGPMEPGGKLYYTLAPLYENGHAFVPVERESALRCALSREEALALIRRLPSLACAEESGNVREREEGYLRLLRSHDSEELARLGKTAWLRQQERAGKRRGTEREERFRRRAEELLYGELAAALGIERERVPETIERILAEAAGTAETPDFVQNAGNCP